MTKTMRRLQHLVVSLVGLWAAISPPHGALGQRMPVLITCGGKSFTDRDGNKWDDDSGVAKSAVSSYKTTNSIGQSNNDELYKSELYDVGNAITEFGIVVPNGIYNVSLHFAEIYEGNQKRGARVFDLCLQDYVMYRDLDIFGTVGAYNALKVDLTARVRNGVMHIGLKRQKDNPKISGIEIRPFTDTPPKFKVWRINCGGRAMEDRSGNFWEKDLYYNVESEEYDAGPRDIRGTGDDILYRTERFDRKTLKYEIPHVPEGAYRVKLHFSENWFTSQNEFARGQTVGAREFDIAIEGSVQLERFDIHKEAGAYTAIIKELPAYVDDGALSLELRAVKTFPKLSGIEIYPVNDVYRWDNYDANGLNLIVMNAMDSTWRRIFQQTVDSWDKGKPDPLTLFQVLSDHDSECEAIPNQIVICNGDYGNQPWTGLNTITMSGGYVRNSVARLNDYYLKGASDDLKQYALCHELGTFPQSRCEYRSRGLGDLRMYPPHSYSHPDAVSSFQNRTCFWTPSH